MSATYAPLAEVDDVEKLTKEQRDAAVNAGKFILYHDGEKVKVGRAVTSFTTTSSTKGESFKKIKLVDTMRMISTDIRRTIEDSYIGKYPNTYDNKVLLLCAIRAYLDELVREEIVDKGYTIDVDTEANATYLTSKGIDVSKMTDDEIKKANTGDHVYLVGHMTLVDTMEDVDIPIYI
jgi:deoxycytidine triphosphate deaminase